MEQAGSGAQKMLSTRRIVFLVVAAAAPIAAMVGNLPLALALGNGPGLPGAFVIATVTLLCFCVGYAAMSRRIINTGAFYTYVGQGLGRPAAVGAAMLAVVSYTALAVGLAGASGYFIDLVLTELGVSAPWWLYSGACIAVIGVLGYRSIGLSAKVLSVLITAEIVLLAVFDVAVIAQRGSEALPVQAIAPQTVLSGGLGIGLMFAFASYVGFESAALYGEESANPTRSIPRATYAAVGLIGVFYFATIWVTIGAIGVDATRDTARAELGNLLFTLTTSYISKPVSDLMAVVLCTSLLASMLAVHNAATRYLFALGRERLLPAALGRFHPRRYAPSTASLTQTVIAAVAVTAFAVGGLDPYSSLATSMVGLSTLGIVALQAMAAIAIVVYFRREPGAGIWRTVVAPAVGAIGLTSATVLLVANYADLTGTDSVAINSLPILLPLVVIGGVGYARWLRSRKPRVYAGLAQARLRSAGIRRARVVPQYTKRYCVVGAGPSGLVMARALLAEGVPYDHFERHHAAGGIWDPENPGSPMYDSAHFISSKHLSHFYGFPMPAEYPDYPNHRQILEYIRAFADAYRLTERITFGVEVVRAEPLGENASDGWRVTLDTGQTRDYAGIICANGVTWHPNLPEYPGLADYRGELRHTVTYRSTDELADRRVLVVGAGNSGVDIACDAAQRASTTFLSLRRGYRFIPKHIFGIPTDVFVKGALPPPPGVVVPDDPTRLIDSLVGDLTRYGLPAPDHAALSSHPIMNTQIIHHLAHGDVSVKPDVASFTPTGATFSDGSHEQLDLVLLATGYRYRIPYLDDSLMQWQGDRPQLYLNMFHRTLEGLYVLGFIEFADAAYQRFDDMASLIVLDIHARETGDNQAELRAQRAGHFPDLRGAMTYVDSARHTNYVEARTYQHVLTEIRHRYGWPDPGQFTTP